jgi:hypothetical protein
LKVETTTTTTAVDGGDIALDLSDNFDSFLNTTEDNGGSPTFGQNLQVTEENEVEASSAAAAQPVETTTTTLVESRAQLQPIPPRGHISVVRKGVLIEQEINRLQLEGQLTWLKPHPFSSSAFTDSCLSKPNSINLIILSSRSSLSTLAPPPSTVRVLDVGNIKSR